MRYILHSFLCILSIFLCVCGCVRKNNQEEKKWMENFFGYLLYQQAGAYTLWGTKPMTVFELDMRSEEERNAVYAQLPKEVKEELPILIDMNHKVGRKKYRILSKKEMERVMYVSYDYLDFALNWERWEKYQKDLKISHYRFIKRTNKEQPNCPWVFFVSTDMALEILGQYYSLFKEVVGFEFDPVSVLGELEQEDSVFWLRVMTDDRTWGTLLGFGRENAECYYQKYTEKRQLKHSGHPSEPRYQAYKIRTLEELPIPGFVSFSQNDPIVRKYLKEKETIQTIYKNEDFLQVTLERLLRDP